MLVLELETHPPPSSLGFCILILLLKLFTYFEVLKTFLLILFILWISVGEGIICTVMRLGASGSRFNILFSWKRDYLSGIALFYFLILLGYS